MQIENEIQDSNLEGGRDTNLDSEFNADNSGGDIEKVKEYGRNQKIRAEKAEKEAKTLKAQLSKTKENETPKNENKDEKSNEPDYARLAFLESRKVENPDDQKIVLDEAKRLNLPLTDILGMEHIKSRLKTNNDQR